MDIEEISQTLYKEQNQKLKAIPADFYPEAEKYIRELEKEIGMINNPRSPESKMLNDEHEGALSALETIFMKRIGKVIEMATFQSHANKPISKDIEKLLPAEKLLYDLVIQGIEAAKVELLGPILYPDSGKTADWPCVWASRQAPASVHPEAKKFEEGNATAERKGTEPGKNNINEKYVVVRILKDLPTFTGADGRNYTVNAEDVVVLPQLNATGLIKRNAAKLIAEGDKSPVEKNSEKN
jgi:DNA replication factor GINS